MASIQDQIFSLLPIRRGHFRLESGHHGDLWLDLELLCLDPEPIQQLASQLAARVAAHKPDIVCGPLVEGAFVALMAASKLGLPFCYSERIESPAASQAGPPADRLYPVKYRLPNALRPIVHGKRVAVVNDVINAGSAVRGTLDDLAARGARPVAIASLLVLGSWAFDYAKAEGLPLETLASLPNTVWPPSDCPLCRKGVPLTG